MNKHSITEGVLKIYDSYKVPKGKFRGQLIGMKTLHPKSNVWKRSMLSLKTEWAVHNALYACGLFRTHTKDVDMQYPLCFLARFVYVFFGTIIWPFIK